MSSDSRWFIYILKSISEYTYNCRAADGGDLVTDACWDFLSYSTMVGVMVANLTYRLEPRAALSMLICFRTPNMRSTGKHYRDYYCYAYNTKDAQKLTQLARKIDECCLSLSIRTRFQVWLLGEIFLTFTRCFWGNVLRAITKMVRLHQRYR